MYKINGKSGPRRAYYFIFRPKHPFQPETPRTDLSGEALRRTFPGLHTLRPVPATPYSAPASSRLAFA